MEFRLEGYRFTLIFSLHIWHYEERAVAHKNLPRCFLMANRAARRAAQICYPLSGHCPLWDEGVGLAALCLGEAGSSGGADLLSVRALRLKWRMIWWSGSGCFSISSSSSSSTLGDFYINQCRQVLGMDLSMRHINACEQRDGKAQSTECVR